MNFLSAQTDRLGGFVCMQTRSTALPPPHVNFSLQDCITQPTLFVIPDLVGDLIPAFIP